MTLKTQIEEILATIGTSRRAVQDGKFIDLTELEKNVANLHETIAKDPGDTDGMKSEDLMSFLNSIMEGLDELDKELRLTAEQKGIDTPADADGNN